MMLYGSLFAAIAVAVTCDAWADIVRLEQIDEELSYLLLAPVVIGWLAWVRRDEAKKCREGGEWVGLLILLGGWVVYRYGYVSDPFFWRAGAVVMLAGAFLAGAGRDVLLRFLPAFAAFAFLIPVDPNGRYHIAVPLQEAVAQCTQSICDVLGMAVTRSGNVLQVNGVDVTVAEACNGMRMVLTLFMVCYVVAFAMPLTAWGRFLVLAASPLVAIVSNVIRLVPTVWMFGNTSRATAERFHDLSGWLMTILSFLLLVGFCRVLRPDSTEPQARPAT
jgi:exosortase